MDVFNHSQVTKILTPASSKALEQVKALFEKLMTHKDFAEVWQKVQICDHKLPDGSLMEFHQEDALDLHHTLACVQAYNQCKDFVSERDMFILMWTAFIHDIGKPYVKTMNEGNNVTSFAGHGSAGAIIWQTLADKIPLLKETFTVDEITRIRNGICYHMCGLHRTTCQQIDQKLASWMSVLPQDSIDLLYHLNIADVYGSICPTFDESLYQESRKFWKEQLVHKSVQDAYQNTATKYYNGLFITLSGPSGSGKTFVAKRLMEIFGDDAIHVERDRYTVETAAPYLQQEYAVLVKKYQVGKILQKWSKDQSYVQELIDHPELLESGCGYDIAYTIYSVESLSMEVNKKMKSDIGKNLRKKVIIADSLIFGTTGQEQVVPLSVNFCFRLNIFCVPQGEVTEEVWSRRSSSKDGFIKKLRTGFGFEILNKGRNSVMESCLYQKNGFPTRFFDRVHPFMRILMVQGEDNKWQMDYFRQLPEMHKFFLTKRQKKYDTNYKLDQPEALSEFLLPLYEEFEYDAEALHDYLDAIGYELRKLSATGFENVYLITYKDYMMMWNTPYCHSTRGTVFVLNKDSIQVLKAGPPKSPEIQSKQSADANIETQEVNATLGWGHQYVQEVIIGKADDTLEYVYSGKRDGSLCQWTLVPHTHAMYDWIGEQIMMEDNKSVGQFIKKLWTINPDFGIIMSSQNTMLVNVKQLLSWYCSSVIHCYTEHKVTKETKFPDMVDMMKPFLDKLVHLNDTPDIMTVSCEAVCADRTDPKYEQRHTELAVSYDTFNHCVIGLRRNMGQNTIGKWVPHYRISRELFNLGLKEPLFWNLAGPEDINTLIKAVQTGSLANFPKPDNFGLPAGWKDSEIIDPEGGMLYATGGKHDLVDLSCKLKDCYYYIFHKLEKYINSPDPVTGKPWSVRVFEITGWYLDRYPIVSQMQKVNDLIYSKIGEVVEEVKGHYLTWLDSLEKRDGKPFYQITGKKTRSFTLEDPSKPFVRPFLPMFLSAPTTRTIIDDILKERISYKSDSLKDEIRGRLLKNQQWFMEESPDYSQEKFQNIFELLN